MCELFLLKSYTKTKLKTYIKIKLLILSILFIFQNNRNNVIKRHILISASFWQFDKFRTWIVCPWKKRKQFIKCVNFTVDQDLCYISVTNWSCPFFQPIFFSFTLTTFFYPPFVMWLKSSKWYMPKKNLSHIFLIYKKCSKEWIFVRTALSLYVTSLTIQIILWIFSVSV